MVSKFKFLLVLGLCAGFTTGVVAAGPITGGRPALYQDDSADNPPPPYGDFQDFANWIIATNADLPNIQFSFMREQIAASEASLSQTSAFSAPPLSAFSSQELLENWLNYQRVWRDYTRAFFGVPDDLRAAPHNVDLLSVIEVDFETVRYAIEIITWDAFGGMTVPANIYRPVDPEEPRLPVVLTPLGCGSNLATHDDSTSVQRRAANLALRGFMVVAMNGFCNNGIISEIPGNHYGYRTYADSAGTGQQIAGYDILMWTRMLDYLETRPDVDMNRIAVTGYSAGGSTSDLLFALDTRVSARAIVATGLAFFTPTRIDTNPDDVYVSFWAPAATQLVYADHFVYSPGRPPLFSPPDDRALRQSEALLPREILPVRAFDPTRSHLRVIGIDDEGTSINDHQAWLALMRQAMTAVELDPSNQTLVTVSGGHNYNAERRRTTGDWLSQQLYAHALIAPPPDQYEHETPILERSRLEPMPNGFGSVTLHDLFSEDTLQFVAQWREDHLFPVDDPVSARAALRSLLLMPEDSSLSRRPIEFRKFDFIAGSLTLSARRVLVPLAYPGPIYADAIIIVSDQEAPVDRVMITVIDDHAPLPDSTVLNRWLAEGYAVIVLHPPGYGSLVWPQTSRGDHAHYAVDYGYTLAGVGVSSVLATASLAQSVYPGAQVELYANGVEASILGMLATALDERIGRADVYNSVHSFLDFLTAPTLPIMPPTLLVPGILSTVDVGDLQRLAGERTITIHSFSDLASFYPDF